MADSADRKRMLGEIKKLGNNYRGILCLQEVHGLTHDVLSSLQACLPHWTPFYSGCVDPHSGALPNSGGILTIINNKILSSVQAHNVEIVPGRVMATILKQGPSSFEIVNLHNYGLHSSEAKVVSTHLKTSFERDFCSGGVSVTFVAGDFNYLPIGEKAWHLHKPHCPIIGAAFEVQAHIGSTGRRGWRTTQSCIRKCPLTFRQGLLWCPGLIGFIQLSREAF